MNVILKILAACFLLVWCANPVKAKHIVGGDMSYVCLLSDTVNRLVNYRITMHLYRDCSNPEGAAYDTDAKFGIYEKTIDGRFRFVRQIIDQRYLNPIRDIDPTANNPCLIVPPGVCVQDAVYQFITGPLPMLNAGSYYIAYQRCCRNETISNIIRPGDAGAAFVIEITAAAQKNCNNSPVFKGLPPVVICVNSALTYDHSAVDADGDLVTYEFCDPLTAGGQDGSQGGKNSCTGVTPDPSACLPPFVPVNFRAPLYSTINPMGGDPVISIDPVTGMITGTPRVQGQFVVGVCMREFRNGELLTETRRDFQFNVAFCEPQVFAKVQADSTIQGKVFVVNACGTLDVDFVNLSTDVKFIRKYRWEFDVQGTKQVQTSRDARFSFPDIGSFTGKMVLNEGTECSDSLDLLVNTFPEIVADYQYAYDTCVAGPIAFEDLSRSGSGQILNWNWNFANSGNSTVADPLFQFATPGRKDILLRVKDVNGCEDSIKKQIPYYPVPPLLIVDPDRNAGCSPLDVCFRNLSSPIDTAYKVTWDFGDGSGSSAISPCHRFNDAGNYSVYLEVVSPLGCRTDRIYPGLIDVSQSPKAAFEMNPDRLNSLSPIVRITDQSQFSNNRIWQINRSEQFNQSDLEYTFRDTGIQQVQLIALSTNGCRDTLTQYIDVEPIVSFFLPNAFTPNGDAKNDGFLGVGYTLGMMDFELAVWDRWGSLLFSTGDPDLAWNGRRNNLGELLPGGVYVYTLQYLTPRRQQVRTTGYVTLIR